MPWCCSTWHASAKRRSALGRTESREPHGGAPGARARCRLAGRASGYSSSGSTTAVAASEKFEASRSRAPDLAKLAKARLV